MNTGMLELVNTRFRHGYSACGPPPVVDIELRFTPGLSADGPGLDARLQWLGRHELIAPQLANRSRDVSNDLARIFGGLVAGLLTRGGHHCGAPQIEPSAAQREHLIVHLPCEEPETASMAVSLAARLLFGPDDGPAEWVTALESFFDEAGARLPHPDTHGIIRAARDRNLPVMRLDQAPFETSPHDRPFHAGLIQIGLGARRRVLAGAVPAMDNKLLMRVANRELLIEQLLRHGLPLPPQDLDFRNKNRASRAVQAAERLAGPVSMRSLHRSSFAHARQAVSLFEPLLGEREITLAYQAASHSDRYVWVEAAVKGDRIRCLVIGGVLVAATRNQPPTIIGNGRHSVAELIEQAGRQSNTPRQRYAWRKLQAGDPDLQVRLALHGLQSRSVPEAGRAIVLRGEGTACNGGALDDVLEHLSTPIRRLAERAAAALELNEIAAVDLAVTDLNGEASAPNCYVLDVVPDPDLFSHIECAPELEQRLHGRLVEVLFPPGQHARIPVVAITGTNGKTTTSRMTAAILRRVYEHVGLATTEGAFLNESRLITGDVAGVTGAAPVLADDRTQAAVLETARGRLHRSGTVLENVDAAACLNIASDHLGIDGIDTLEELAAVKSRVLHLADGAAIVNADDPRCLGMLKAIEGAQPILVSRHPDSGVVGEHLDAGHRAVLVTRSPSSVEWLSFAQGKRLEPVIPTHDIPAVMDGLLPFNALNAAFAAALCWSIGIDTEAIRDGLKQFDNSVRGNPGRYNFIKGYPFTLLLDFAQNTHGLDELYSVIDRLPTSGRRRLVCLTIGSRHREHIDENADRMAGYFDSLVIGCSAYADDNPQWAGANPKATMLEYFRQRLLEAGAGPDRVEVHEQPENAIKRGLELSGRGDLLIILGSPKVVLPVLEEKSES